MVGLGVIKPGNVRSAVAFDFQFQGLNAQAGHSAVPALAVRQQGICVQTVNQRVYTILNRRLRKSRRSVFLRRACVKGNGGQVLQPSTGRLAAVEQMVADQGGSIGAELSGNAVIGGGSPAERQTALLTQILPAQTADRLVDMDAAENYLIHQRQVLFCQRLLL